MRHREFALCAVRSEAGVVGRAFTYTRDGPVVAIVDRLVAPQYVGRSYDDPSALTYGAGWSNNANLAAGTGFRALGLVDLATWDLKARAAEVPIARILGGEVKPVPVVARVGSVPPAAGGGGGGQGCVLRPAGGRRVEQRDAHLEER